MSGEPKNRCLATGIIERTGIGLTGHGGPKKACGNLKMENKVTGEEVSLKENMTGTSYWIRPMELKDYDWVYALWMGIHGFGIRSIDDSREGVERFLKRNPGLSVVAESDGQIVGSILCGHDGRRGCLYHVCVREDFRNRGIGRAMAVKCMEALKAEGINKVNLIAYRTNEVGNRFWTHGDWTFRDDLNYYDFVLNEENITRFLG